MTTRDLTRLFTEKRCEYHAPSVLRKPKKLGRRFDFDADCREPLISTEYRERDNRADECPPTYVKGVDQLNADIRNIVSQMEQLSQLHRGRLLVRFDGMEDHQDEEINRLTNHITTTFRRAEAALKRINQTVSERQLRSNIQQSLAVRLQQLSSSFRKSQQEYLRQLTVQKKGGAFRLSQDFDGLEAGESAQEQLFRQTDMMISASELIAIERDQELEHILKSIRDLHSIFSELSAMIVDQGTILDRVDYNMERVVSKMASGLKHLREAEKNQMGSSRANRCIAILLCSIVFMALVLVAKHRLRYE